MIPWIDDEYYSLVRCCFGVCIVAVMILLAAVVVEEGEGNLSMQPCDLEFDVDLSYLIGLIVWRWFHPFSRLKMDRLYCH